MTDTPAASHRLIASALALVAAGGLVVAAFGHRWLCNEQLGDFGFGLLSYQACSDGVCASESNFAVVASLRGASGAFAPLGIATFALSLLGALGLAASALFALIRRRPRMPILPTTVALLAVIPAILTGCVFVAVKPEAEVLGVGWSFWVFGAGAVAGLAGALMTNRHVRPIDDDDPEDLEPLASASGSFPA